MRLMNIPQPPLPSKARAEAIWQTGLLAATTLNCALRIVWFWRFRAHSINEDGIAYVGLARHLIDGDSKAFLHGCWSPLTSWIIAAASLSGRNFTRLERLVTIASFLLCLLLLYALTLRPRRSRTAAALAMFWFSATRGIVYPAVGSIVADFVLTACALFYFILLLDVLRHNKPAHWIKLGRLTGWHSWPTQLPCLGFRLRAPSPCSCETDGRPGVWPRLSCCRSSSRDRVG